MIEDSEYIKEIKELQELCESDEEMKVYFKSELHYHEKVLERLNNE